jgi:hypothetical protein
MSTVLPTAMKNSSFYDKGFCFILIICSAVFSVFVTAQNDMELVAARKRASELVSSASPDIPEPCVVADSGEGRGKELSFPEGRADEVYVWDNSGYAYFKIENDKAIIKWRGFALDLEGQPANQNNSFIKIESHFSNGKPVSFNSQCGELPDFNGRLEFFGVGITTAYNGVYSSEGELLCRNILSEDVDPMDPNKPEEQYYYGVARCDEKQ